MSFLNYIDFLPWLAAFVQNIAMGLVLLLLYNSLRATLRIKRPAIASILIGILFGGAAIASMAFPVHTPTGLSVDARIVFVLVGGMFGGPVGGTVATATAVLYRISIGGPGALPGSLSIIVSGVVGGLAARRYRGRVHDLGALPLFVIGLINTAIATLLIEAVFALRGMPLLPAAPLLAGFVAFPLGTVFLGMATGSIHDREWRRTRQRLADILEMTTDLVWETDSGGRFRFLSRRLYDTLGSGPADYIGRRPQEAGARWIDAATKQAAAKAYAARTSFSGLMQRMPGPDGFARVMSITGRPIWDERGRFAGYCGTAQDMTARVEMEEKLRQSRDGLLRAMKMGRIASGEIDLATGTTIWSDEMFEMMGFDKSQVSPSLDAYIEYVHPEDRAALLDLRARNERGESAQPLEFRFIRPDGSIRWFHREVEVERDAAGRPIKLFTTQQDFTDRREMEDALRRSLRTQQMLIRCGQPLIHASDERELVGDVCRTICDAGGYGLAWVGLAASDEAKSVLPLAAHGAAGAEEAAEYVRGLHVSWDEVAERGQGPMGRAIRTGRVVLERNVETAAGYEPWRKRALAHGFNATLTIPLRDGDNVFGGLGIYATEETAFDAEEIALLERLGSELAYGMISLRTRAARDKAERDLRATQNAMRAIMDHTVDGLITIDEAGSILSFSKPASHIFGYGPDEVLGKSICDLVAAPDRGALGGMPWATTIGHEIHGRRNDGTMFPMDLVIGEIPSDATGRRFVATVRDVAQRKRTEAQLQQAQKMEAMGQLTGGVAHDFNNLLAIMLGRLELIEEELSDSPQLLSWVRSCIKALDRGTALTRSLLAFSRQQALMPVALDVNLVLREMEDMLARVLGETYRLAVVREPAPWVTEADPGQLQNALLNLVLNARDAMPNGGTLTIKAENAHLDADYAGAHRDVLPGDYVCLSVSDTGSGISPEIMERVFEPFFTTKDTGKGSGLGLSMVYGFVRQSGGHVTIDSEPGHGTTVRLYLPRATSRQDGFAVQSDALPASPGGETILLVEDNEDLRDLTRTQLERLGYTVVPAADALEALRLLERNRDVALLLSDIVLPQGVSGTELAERAVAGRPSLRVVFMSGYSEDHELIASVLQRRPGRLLQKPFHAEELARQVRAALA